MKARVGIPKDPLSLSRPVWVLHKDNTTFALHPVCPLTHRSRTVVAMFISEAHARVWQRGLNIGCQTGDGTVVREFPRWPRQFVWEEMAVRHGNPPEVVTVKCMSIKDLCTTFRGRDVKFRMFINPYDPRAYYDLQKDLCKTQVVERLEHDFTMNRPDRGRR